MNRILALLAASLLLLSCSGTKQSETAVTEWNEGDLRGNVKSVTTYLYSYEKELVATDVELYNENNRLVELIAYRDADTLLDKRTLYSYNNDGNITIKINISYRYNQKGDTSAYIYTYNNKGLNVSIEEDPFGVIEKEYNEQGLLVREIAYGDENTETLYTYHKNGSLAEMRRVYDHIAYEYDNGGKLTGCKTYENGSNLLLLSQSYGYDNKGRLVKETRRDAESTSTLDYDKTMRYDDKNRLAELRVVNHSGETERLVTYTYNQNDNMVEQKLLIPYMSATEISAYTYDERGNWIEAQYSFDTTRAFAVREIVYYP